MKKTFLAALVALTALAGCTTDNENAERDAYPPEARENFVDQCVESALKVRGGDRAEQERTCTCVVDNLEEKLPYQRDGANNDFKDADALVRDGRPLPTSLRDPFDEATADCRPDR
jgi:hypothetical protein